MCDYDSDYSDIDLYDIPEFPGYDQLQVGPEGEPAIRASNECAEQCSSESGADSEDDVIFILSKPARATLRPDIRMVDDTAHHDLVSHSHVTNFRQPNPSEISRTTTNISPALNCSAENKRKESTAYRQQRLLRGIIADPL